MAVGSWMERTGSLELLEVHHWMAYLITTRNSSIRFGFLQSSLPFLYSVDMVNLSRYFTFVYFFACLILKQNNLSNPPTPPASLPPTPPPVAKQKLLNGFATAEELARKAEVLGKHEGVGVFLTAMSVSIPLFYNRFRQNLQ